MRRLVLLLAAVLVAIPAGSAAAAQTTGRLLVTLHRSAASSGARAAAFDAVAASAGAERAGFSVPKLRLVTVRPRRGESLSALARRLRLDPRVARVERETRAEPRYQPNDPALVEAETAPGTAPGTPVEWWPAREGFPAAWDLERGDDAIVAVIDTGVEDAHPELAGRIAGSASFDPGGGPATTDPVGHGTHVASLACGAGDNGAGLTGAGLHCRLLAISSDFSDSSVAASIVWAVDHGADAINMSFGTSPGAAPTQPVIDAIDYAFAHNVVMVAAAADQAIEEQGHPSNVLQPTGTGPDIALGKGLSVTAADFSDQRADFAGRGTQISLAAYGTYDEQTGPAGIFGAFTTNANDLERGQLGLPPQPPCNCRTTFDGDPRYAYLQGTSMAAPMVAGAAALVRRLNPDLSAADVIRVIKQTARRPGGGGWTPDLGWGILDAGAAVAAARVMDRRPPASKMLSAPARTHQTAVRLRWRGADQAPPKVRRAGIARFELWRSIDGGPPRRIFTTTRGLTKLVPVSAGSSYGFFTIAVDRAGNREAPPTHPDIRVKALPPLPKA
jgi:subtilisin family serine protease